MQFDKRTLLASLLIVLIFVFIQSNFYERLYGRLFGRAVPAAPATTKSATPDDSAAAAATAAPAFTPEAGDTLVSAPPSQAGDWQKEKQLEREIIVETPLYRGVLSSLGGTIKEWQFKKYSYHSGAPIVIVQQGSDNLSVILPGEADSLNTSQYNFDCKDAAIQLQAGEKRTLVFEREIAPGRRVRKTYEFSADDYTIGLRLELENVNDLVAGYHYSLRWHSGLATTEPSLKTDMTDARAYTFIGEDILDLDVGDKPYKELKEDERDIAWAATRTKYFTCAIVPGSQPARGVVLSGSSIYVPNQEARLKSYQMDLKMPLARQSATRHDFKIYLGPIDYDRLEALGIHHLMNLGWSIIRPFSWIVLKSLRWLHNFVPNYGVVIIIFSFLIKIVLHPLTKKTNESMKQMQVLQPKMKELQEKYSKDPQRLNEEMMKLYREYGVNPLGGCLPLLLQMPLLFAMFTVFGSTIEFRQAPFVGWIQDLSAPDTIFRLPFSLPLYGNQVALLPLLMGITMFIQQKMSITDPKQKAMIYIMPVMFTLMFNNFPSGLNLYYALFNVLSILQQKYMTKPPEDLEERRKKMKELAQIKRGGLHAALSRKRLMKK